MMFAIVKADDGWDKMCGVSRRRMYVTPKLRPRLRFGREMGQCLNLYGTNSAILLMPI